MEFHINHITVRIADTVINQYREAVGLLPNMKTDDRWLSTFFFETFHEEVDAVLKAYTPQVIEQKLTMAINSDTKQYIAQGGGIFK